MRTLNSYCIGKIHIILTAMTNSGTAKVFHYEYAVRDRFKRLQFSACTNIPALS